MGPGSNLTIINSTFAGNSATNEGGAIGNGGGGGMLIIKNSTIAGNTAGSTGGGFNNASGTSELYNTIMANNIPDDCRNSGGTVNINTNNLIETNNGCPAPLISVDPQLGSRQDNGGSVHTMALPPGSPALDAGNNTTCLATDARGFARPQNGTCDIGAFEKQLPAFTSTAITAATEDAAYSYAITTSDPDSATPLTITAPTLPAWLSLTDNGDGTGTLSGTPVNGDVGANSVVLSLNQAGENVQQSFTITVAGENDAPVLDDSGTPALTAIPEDAANPAGDLVSALIAALAGITDVDAGAVAGIAVTAADDNNGTWEYSTDTGGTWTAFGAVADNAAVVLTATAADLVRFVPAADFNGDVDPGLTFRAWDTTDGNPSGTGSVDTSANGGTSAYSTATETASISVTAVNDAPVLDDSGTPALTTIPEDTADPSGDPVSDLIAALGGSGITDADNGAVVGIAVTAADDNNGTWEYSTDTGGTWTAFGAVADNAAVVLTATAADLVRFVPAADFVTWIRASLSAPGTPPTAIRPAPAVWTPPPTAAPALTAPRSRLQVSASPRSTMHRCWTTAARRR